MVTSIPTRDRLYIAYFDTDDGFLSWCLVLDIPNLQAKTSRYNAFVSLIIGQF